MADPAEIAEETLSLLEARLNRLQYLLEGNALPNTEPQTTRSLRQPAGAAAARLSALEHGLSALTSRSQAAKDVLALHRHHPQLFRAHPAGEVPTTLPQPALISLVLAHSGLYRTVASQLSQLQGTDVPDTSAVASLVEKCGRLEKARLKQEQQAEELTQLRTRSAQLVEAWHQEGVLGVGDSWAQWEERLREAEILVRRREAAKKRDEGPV